MRPWPAADGPPPSTMRVLLRQLRGVCDHVRELDYFGRLTDFW